MYKLLNSLFKFILYIEKYNYKYFRTDIEPENPQHEQYISNMVISLIQELESKAASLQNERDLFLAKLKLTEAAKTFRVSYILHSI